MAQDDRNRNSMITDEMLILFLCGIMLLGIWYVGHTFFVAFFSSIWFVEIKVIGLFTPVLDKVSDFIAHNSFASVQFHQFYFIAGAVGQYTRWIWGPLLICTGFYYLFIFQENKFSKKHTIESLKNNFAKVWPHASIFFTKDIKKIGVIGQGTESAMKPREFCKRFNLLNEDGELIEAKAEQVFVSQLGPLFSGIDTWVKNPSQHYKMVLFTLFCLKYYRMKDDFASLRDGAAREFNLTGKLAKTSEKALELAKQFYILNEDHSNLEKVKLYRRLKRFHAYEYTLLYSMFSKSKRGVFASCEFRWLKVFNRTLWYGLNSVHRRVAWIESAGIKAQWLAEESAGKPIKTPLMAEAVVGLREALTEIAEKLVDDFDYTKDDEDYNE